MNVWSSQNLVSILWQGKVVVMPTDTIYGVVGRALDKGTVERIHEMKKRDPKKPLIVLLGDWRELGKFSIELTSEQKQEIKKKTTEPISFVIDFPNDAFSYLHRGTGTLAVRLPDSREFRDFLLKTGPLVAPSANPEGLPPAKNIEEAKRYFGTSVDFYQDGGEIIGKASKLVRLLPQGGFVILRE